MNALLSQSAFRCDMKNLCRKSFFIREVLFLYFFFDRVLFDTHCVCVFVHACVLVLFNRFLIALPQLLDTAFCQPDSAKCVARGAH